jgi:hypothetical protein
MAASPSSDECDSSGSFIESAVPGQTDSGRPGRARLAAMNTDIWIAVGGLTTIHGAATVNANPGIA